MERVVEPELMDDDAQAQAYAEADFAVAHERFVDLFRERWPRDLAGDAGPVLDLGCGPGDIVIRVARRCPALVIHGVDGSDAMLRLGQERVREEGLEGRVHLTRALLPHDPPPLPRYPVVMSNSLLHHLHDPAVLWSAVSRFGAPRAYVFVMDLRRPERPSDVDALVGAHTVGAPPVLRRDFRASLHAAFTVEEVASQTRAAGLEHLAVEAIGTHHVAVWGQLRP